LIKYTHRRQTGFKGSKVITVTNFLGETVTIEVGDIVSFKSDVEQGGEVAAINGKTLTLKNDEGFEGAYIGGKTTTTISANLVWKE
jgi:hypothetical protein